MNDGSSSAQYFLNRAFLEEIWYDCKVESALVLAFGNQGAFASQGRDVVLAADQSADAVASFKSNDQRLESNIARDTGNLRTSR